MTFQLTPTLRSGCNKFEINSSGVVRRFRQKVRKKVKCLVLDRKKTTKKRSVNLILDFAKTKNES